MAYGSYGDGFGAPRATPWVKRLLIANITVFAVLVVLGLVAPELRLRLEEWLIVWRETVLRRPWTVVTYAFVHGGLGHIFFNMLALFFFGPPLEERWGARGFLTLYAVSTIAAAALALLMPSPVLGASGAVYGVMLAFAALWPDEVVHVWGIFPIRVKWFVAALAAISVVLSIQGGGGNISYLAHLGGMVGAAVYLASPWAPSSPWQLRRWTAGARSNAPASRSLPVPARRRSRPAEPRRGRDPEAPGSVRRSPADADTHEIDRILDKISTSGLTSLTDEERHRLKRASEQRRS